MKEETREFAASNYLDSEEMRTEYLRAALETGDEDLIKMAQYNIAKSREEEQC